MDIGNEILVEEEASMCELDEYILLDVWGLLCFESKSLLVPYYSTYYCTN